MSFFMRFLCIKCRGANVLILLFSMKLTLINTPTKCANMGLLSVCKGDIYLVKHTISLTENYQFRYLYHRGKNIVTPNVVIYMHKNKQASNRLGVTTSKKIGNAVQRNRAKRLITEAYRLLELQLPKGYDYVLVARKKTVFSTMQDVKASLKKALL